MHNLYGHVSENDKVVQKYHQQLTRFIYFPLKLKFGCQKPCQCFAKISVFFPNACKFCQLIASTVHYRVLLAAANG